LKTLRETIKPFGDLAILEKKFPTTQMLVKHLESVTFIIDESNTALVYEAINNFHDFYVSQEKYLPISITPFCYRSDFKHKNLTQKLFVSLLKLFVNQNFESIETKLFLIFQNTNDV